MTKFTSWAICQIPRTPRQSFECTMPNLFSCRSERSPFLWVYKDCVKGRRGTREGQGRTNNQFCALSDKQKKQQQDKYKIWLVGLRGEKTKQKLEQKGG